MEKPRRPKRVEVVHASDKVATPDQIEELDSRPSSSIELTISFLPMPKPQKPQARKRLKRP